MNELHTYYTSQNLFLVCACIHNSYMKHLRIYICIKLLNLFWAHGIFSCIASYENAVSNVLHVYM